MRSEVHAAISAWDTPFRETADHRGRIWRRRRPSYRARVLGFSWPSAASHLSAQSPTDTRTADGFTGHDSGRHAVEPGLSIDLAGKCREYSRPIASR